MINVFLTLDIIIAIALIGIILIQRSEGGVLGMGGSKMGGVLTGKGAGNLLTKMTTILGISFFVVTFILAVLVSRYYKQDKSMFEKSEVQQQGETKNVDTLNPQKIPEDQMKEEMNKEAAGKKGKAPSAPISN